MSVFHETSECDIVALNYLSNAELEARYRSLTNEPPPRLSRLLLVTEVAYETVRLPHRKLVIRRQHATNPNREPGER